MRGVALLFLPTITKESNKESRALFEQALKIDPNFAVALAGEAWTYMFEYIYGWTNPETDYDAKILGLADRSIALDPDHPYGYGPKSAYLLYSNRPSEAFDVADAGSRTTQIPLKFTGHALTPKLPSAVSNKRNPMRNKRCG